MKILLKSTSHFLFFCKNLNILKVILKLLKITMFFTLFKSYLKKYLMFCKIKKWLVDINRTYIYFSFIFAKYTLLF